MTAAEILQIARSKGFDIVLEGDRLRIRRGRRLPADLLAAITQHRRQLALLVRMPRKVDAPDAKVGGCLYDWAPGQRWRKLHCVAHRSHGGSPSVSRLIWQNYDTLAEMLALRVLTGQAAADAKTQTTIQ